MKKGNQKQKSNAHERAVAEILTKAYYPDGDGEFRRTPMSGGWDRKAAPGDVIALRYVRTGDPMRSDQGQSSALDSTFPLSVECKNWKDCKHFFSGLYSAESDIWAWMQQARDDAAQTGKIPLVVFKLYRAANIAMVSHQDFTKLSEYFGKFGGAMYRAAKIQPEGGDAVFVMFADFVEWIDWGFYKIAAKTQYIRSLVKR